MSNVTWLLESDVFPNSHSALRRALSECGNPILDWDDAWWTDANFPRLVEGPVIFHGSLANASRIADQRIWFPGAWCHSSRFDCSAWYDAAQRWLLHERWLLTTVAALTAAPRETCARINAADRVFVRPNSPLKPFAGRVVEISRLTAQALDYGFYYDDIELPVIIAPVVEIEREWRFVVANGNVVGHGNYQASSRSAQKFSLSSHVREFAEFVAKELEPPEPVYVMDVCESSGSLRLLELNPFSGADLYECPSPQMVHAVDAACRSASQQSTR